MASISKSHASTFIGFNATDQDVLIGVVSMTITSLEAHSTPYWFRLILPLAQFHNQGRIALVIVFCLTSAFLADRKYHKTQIRYIIALLFFFSGLVVLWLHLSMSWCSEKIALTAHQHPCADPPLMPMKHVSTNLLLANIPHLIA